MSPYDFVYNIITLLLLNDNAFVYPMFDAINGGVKALYPLRPSLVEALMDTADSLYLKFYFENGEGPVLYRSDQRGEGRSHTHR